MKNVVKIFGIPMSSLGGVHLISEIAQFIPFEINTSAASSEQKIKGHNWVLFFP